MPTATCVLTRVKADVLQLTDAEIDDFWRWLPWIFSLRRCTTEGSISVQLGAPAAGEGVENPDSKGDEHKSHVEGLAAPQAPAGAHHVFSGQLAAPVIIAAGPQTYGKGDIGGEPTLEDVTVAVYDTDWSETEAKTTYTEHDRKVLWSDEEEDIAEAVTYQREKEADGKILSSKPEKKILWSEEDEDWKQDVATPVRHQCVTEPEKKVLWSEEEQEQEDEEDEEDVAAPGEDEVENEVEGEAARRIVENGMASAEDDRDNAAKTEAMRRTLENFPERKILWSDEEDWDEEQGSDEWEEGGEEGGREVEAGVEQFLAEEEEEEEEESKEDEVAGQADKLANDDGAVEETDQETAEEQEEDGAEKGAEVQEHVEEKGAKTKNDEEKRRKDETKQSEQARLAKRDEKGFASTRNGETADRPGQKSSASSSSAKAQHAGSSGSKAPANGAKRGRASHGGRAQRDNFAGVFDDDDWPSLPGPILRPVPEQKGSRKQDSAPSTSSASTAVGGAAKPYGASGPPQAGSGSAGSVAGKGSSMGHSPALVGDSESAASAKEQSTTVAGRRAEASQDVASPPPSSSDDDRGLLALLCGEWRDTQGSSYKLSLDRGGASLSVQTVRPDLTTLFTKGLIRLSRRPHKGGVEIVWGTRPSFVLAGPPRMGDTHPSQICWSTPGSAGRSFTWRRQ
mmetsp:Transcript_73736/g.205088  ORF Transcript_73736/g.205088 Transcript_73736/m.205088 type:complete len:681 (+) Transcript_73736:78-2120(+)